MERKKLTGLTGKVYEHDLDKKALASLKGTPGLEFLVKKLNEHIIEKVLRIKYTGDSIKVNSSNFPQVHKALQEACEVLEVEVPSLYLKLSYEINGFTTGVEKPLIVLHTSCVDLLSYDELLFIVGHEVGHIKSRHVLYHMMSEVLPVLGSIIGDATLGIGKLVSSGLELALLQWVRMSEFTADRAGLLACQNPEAVGSAFMKMAGVPEKCHDSINVEDFRTQAREFEEYDMQTLSKIFKVLSTLERTHPWSVIRAAEYYKWVESGAYEKILSGDYSTDNGNGDEFSGQSIFCSQCGTKLTVGDNFCHICGKKV